MIKLSIFLDWFGVIADNNLMTRHWRQIEAKILSQKYGGALSKWTAVHDKAFQWYLSYWSRLGSRSKRSYRFLWKRGEVEWMRRTLRWGGINPLPSETELFRLDRELTYEISRRVDPAYPYARRALNALRREFRLFLVSGADHDFIRGALEATGLKSYFENIFSPDTLDCFKGSVNYWKKVLRRSRSDPDLSTVVDDRVKFLRVPLSLGLKTILVDGNAVVDRDLLRVNSIRELLSSELLPSLKSPAG